MLPTEQKSQNLMMSVFSSETLIFAPECWKCILHGTSEPLHTGHLGEIFHNLHFLGTHSQVLVDSISRYSVDISVKYQFTCQPSIMICQSTSVGQVSFNMLANRVIN